MTAKMTQADFDAMFEAASAAGIVGDVTHSPDPCPARLRRYRLILRSPEVDTSTRVNPCKPSALT